MCFTKSISNTLGYKIMNYYNTLQYLFTNYFVNFQTLQILLKLWIDILRDSCKISSFLLIVKLVNPKLNIVSKVTKSFELVGYNWSPTYRPLPFVVTPVFIPNWKTNNFQKRCWMKSEKKPLQQFVIKPIKIMKLQ